MLEFDIISSEQLSTSSEQILSIKKKSFVCMNIFKGAFFPVSSYK